MRGEDVDALASFINPRYEDWDMNHVTQCLTYSPPGKLPVGLNNDVSGLKLKLEICEQIGKQSFLLLDEHNAEYGEPHKMVVFPA